MGRVWLEVIGEGSQGKTAQVSDLDALGEKWAIEEAQ
jgi:hypothetical protein